MLRRIESTPLAPAMILFGAVILVGLLLAFGVLPLAPWLAYCLGLLDGAALVGMLMVYVVAWASD